MSSNASGIFALNVLGGSGDGVTPACASAVVATFAVAAVVTAIPGLFQHWRSAAWRVAGAKCGIRESAAAKFDFAVDACLDGLCRCYHILYDLFGKRAEGRRMADAWHWRYFASVAPATRLALRGESGGRLALPTLLARLYIL